MKKIAIMQPTFLPWVGYMALMDYVDEFVYLDHVQFDKRSWQQRNQIKTLQGPQWVTIPVATKGKRGQKICDALINTDNQDYPDKTIKSIEHNYKKAAFYKEYADDVFSILSEGHTRLLETNIALIDFFRQKLDISTPVSFSSQMEVQGQKASLLVDICQKCEATHYISPPGSKEYLDIANDFEESGIPVIYFDYTHPEWTQINGNFEPYMSVLDLLFNRGEEAVEIMRKGVKNT